MFRSILGFALLAIVAWFALKLLLGLLGVAFGFAMSLLWLAGIGFLFYIALRIISPRTADKLRDMIKGRPADAS